MNKFLLGLVFITLALTVIGWLIFPDIVIGALKWALNLFLTIVYIIVFKFDILWFVISMWALYNHFFNEKPMVR